MTLVPRLVRHQIIIIEISQNSQKYLNTAMPKLVSSFSIVRNHKILSFLLLKVNDQKNMIIVLQCNTMKMCFMSTHTILPA
jgi:hypothetical protein